MNTRNFTHNSNFLFTTNLFGEETTYNLQTVNLPGISFSNVQLSKSSIMGNLQGDTPTYSPLNLSFIVDEELKIWKEFINIAQKMRDPYPSEAEEIKKYGYIEIHDDNSKLYCTTINIYSQNNILGYYMSKLLPTPAFLPYATLG